VDEDFQMRAWGQDAEAMARRERRWQEMQAAATVGA
jgi:chaperone required for assembly of F1-ATPase